MLTDILITVFKFQAQSERERIRERQKQGIALAKKEEFTRENQFYMVQTHQILKKGQFTLP